jgi:hypothetical protein
MRLLNARLGLVTREKIADYLLNAAHPDNGGKAEFLASLGFRREEWEVLARASRRLAITILCWFDCGVCRGWCWCW